MVRVAGRVAARQGRTAERANQAQPSRCPDRVERVAVARFTASAGSARDGGSGGATTSTPATAAADPALSIEVSNPAHDEQGKYEDLRDPEATITIPRPPSLARSLVPTISATAGRSRSGGQPRDVEVTRLLGQAPGNIYEDTLPAYALSTSYI